MNDKELKACPECQQNKESGMNFCAFCGRQLWSEDLAEPKQEEYKEYEFCRFIKCHELQDGKCLFDSLPNYCANGYKAFVHNWLKENNYKITNQQ